MKRRALCAVLLVAGCRRPTTTTSATSATPPDAAAPDASSHAAVTVERNRSVPFPRPIASAAFVPNGHVLVVAESALFDWDPTKDAAPRAVETHGTLHVSSGSTRFVVVRDETPKVVLELWDAERLTKIRDLAGVVAGEHSPTFAFSRDRSHYAYGACRGGADGALTCEVDVYRLADGERIRRTLFSRMDVQGYVPSVGLSPNGRFVTVAGVLADAEIRDSATGKVVLRGGAPRWSGVEEQVVWIDDHRVLTRHEHGRKLVVTDLAATNAAQPVVLRFPMKGDDDKADEPRPSPDRKHMATLLVLEGGREVNVWNVEASTSFARPVPRSVCTEGCEVEWASDHEILVHGDEADPKQSLRVDVTTQRETFEPFTPAPAFAAGGFRVFADATARSAEAATTATAKWHAGKQADELAVKVTTKTGARRDLGPFPDRDLGLLTQDDRLLVVGTTTVALVSADGRVTTLESTAKKR